MVTKKPKSRYLISEFEDLENEERTIQEDEKDIAEYGSGEISGFDRDVIRNHYIQKGFFDSIQPYAYETEEETGRKYKEVKNKIVRIYGMDFFINIKCYFFGKGRRGRESYKEYIRSHPHELYGGILDMSNKKIDFVLVWGDYSCYNEVFMDVISTVRECVEEGKEMSIYDLRRETGTGFKEICIHARRF